MEEVWQVLDRNRRGPPQEEVQQTRLRRKHAAAAIKWKPCHRRSPRQPDQRREQGLNKTHQIKVRPSKILGGWTSPSRVRVRVSPLRQSLGFDLWEIKGLSSSRITPGLAPSFRLPPVDQSGGPGCFCSAEEAVGSVLWLTAETCLTGCLTGCLQLLEPGERTQPHSCSTGSAAVSGGADLLSASFLRTF